MGLTNFPNGVGTFLVDSNATNDTVSATIVAVTDSGKTFTSAGGLTFTLPSFATGEVFTFVNLAEDGTQALTIAPQSADGIMYAGSATIAKTLINTALTAKKGDFVKIASMSGTVWEVVDARGVWAKGV